MLASYRIDNLVGCPCAALSPLDARKHHLTCAPNGDFLWTMKRWDREAKEGADSPFLSDVLQRISHSLQNRPGRRYCFLKISSLCVSLDMAHALNPNYIEQT